MAQKKDEVKTGATAEKQPAEIKEGKAVKSDPKPKAEATPKEAKKPAKKKTPAPKKKIPSYMKEQVTEYVVGTEDYRKLVEDYNKRSGSAYNPNRVRPAILYGIWAELKKIYGMK